jgi:hypothetical protein
MRSPSALRLRYAAAMNAASRRDYSEYVALGHDYAESATSQRGYGESVAARPDYAAFERASEVITVSTTA